MMTDGVSTRGTAAFVCALSPEPSRETNQDKSVPMKIKFSPEEDAKLLDLVQRYGAKDWMKIANLMETRNARQCRERFKNYLNPDLRKDPWTREEDEILDQRYMEYGAKWNKISKFFVNRSDNAIRNRWMMMARHRAKAVAAHGVCTCPGPMVAYSPPPSVKPPHQGLTLPVVLPIVKDYSSSQTMLHGDSFEMLEIIESSANLYDADPFSQWSEFIDF
jgi:hypothetical protein